MPVVYIRTSLALCGECIDNPDVDGKCECAVDMRCCAGCGRGPLNDSEDECGEDDCPRDQ